MTAVANIYAYVGGNPVSFADPRGLDFPGTASITKDAQSGRWPNCNCAVVNSPPPVEKTVLNTVVGSGAGGAAIGAVGGGIAGGYYGYAIEGAHLAKHGMHITRILALSDSVLSGAIAGGVTLGAAGVVVGAVIAAAILIPDPICREYCNKNMCK